MLSSNYIHNILICWLLLYVLNNSNAQPNRDIYRDKYWILGDGIEDVFELYGNMILDFSESPPLINTLHTTINLREANASICDTAGNLLFYTNGYSLFDRTHQQMAGWDTLNPGYLASDWFNSGQRMPQGSLILPQPGNDSIYYVFHASHNIFPQFEDYIRGDYFYYTRINMKGNEGLGEITHLNQVLLHEYLDIGKVNACRHANGRDWWIIMCTYNDKYYHLYLLTPQGVQYMGQKIVATPVMTGFSQSVFSPDGNIFVSYQAILVAGGKNIHIYDFDRCLGLIEEKAYITLNDTAVGNGAAISPNSRYLYIMANWKIYQFDLLATNIGATKTTVAVWDGFYDESIPSPTTFNLGQIGPDGKIYVNTRSMNNRYFHVIENPNEAGLACNVAQHSLQLPHYNFVSMPHFPNFRLGAVAGSECDSLGFGYPVSIKPPTTALPTTDIGFTPYPNPAKEYSHLYFGHALGSGYRLMVYDVNGRLAHEAALSTAAIGYTLPVYDWSAGLYVAVLYTPAGTVAASAKIVVER
jgi:hypothetical protein